MTDGKSPAADRVLVWVGRKLFQISALAFVAFVSMAGAFWGVQLWAREQGNLLQGPAAGSDREARALFEANQELWSLTREYLERFDRDDGPASPAFVSWLERRFKPGVNDLRRRLHDSVITGGALTDLIAAADKLAAMALQPDSAEVRNQATEAVLEAKSSVEARLVALGLDGSFTVRN